MFDFLFEGETTNGAELQYNIYHLAFNYIGSTPIKKIIYEKP